jgi:hypothetical protein
VDELDVRLNQKYMRVTRSSKSASNALTAFVLLCALAFSIYLMGFIWPPALNFEWTILGFLVLGFLGGFINVARRLCFPTQLYFELTEEHVRIKDLRRSGHGFREFTFSRRNVSRIHYSNEDGYSSYVEHTSGKRTKLVGEIFESWTEIRALLNREAKDIRITEQNREQAAS